MKSNLLQLKLPSKYKENLIQYIHALDGVPEWIDFAEKGYTMQEYRKFTKLYSIESMKYHMNEAIKENEISDSEIEEAQKLIKRAIQEYNEL